MRFRNKLSAFVLVSLFSVCTAPCLDAAFLRGDANLDEVLDISDAQFTLRFLFLGGESPTCLAAADTNDDEAVDISDAVASLEYLFLGGQNPPEPFPNAGSDPTPGIGCDSNEEPLDNEPPEVRVLSPRAGFVSRNGQFNLRVRIDDDAQVSRLVVNGEDVDISGNASLPRTVSTSIEIDPEPSRAELVSVEVVDEFGRASFVELPVGVGITAPLDDRLPGLAVSIEEPSGFDELEALLDPFLADIPRVLDESLRGVEVFRGSIAGVDIRVNGRSVAFPGETVFTIEPTSASGGRLRLSARFPEVVFTGDGESDFGFLGRDSWTATWRGQNVGIVGTVRFDSRADGQGVDVRSDGFQAQIGSSSFSVSGFLDPLG
ncbi:MAG: hypothetical protein AAF517_24750, partial [Planctomycetota bacterium]